MYAIPSHNFLNPKEIKSGDATTINNDTFEFKTRFELNRVSYGPIVRGYCSNTTNRDMRFTFLFSELRSDFNYIEFIQKLQSVGIREENVQLVSVGQLANLASSPDFIEKFFRLYDVPLTRYTSENYAFVAQKCQNIILNSGRSDIVALAQDYQKKLLLEQTNNSTCLKILRQSPISRTKIRQKPGFEVQEKDSELLDFRVRDISEEPEDIFADIVDLFDDPSDSFGDGGDV